VELFEEINQKRVISYFV